MIGMSTILSIRRRCADGDSVAEIAREEGVSEPTVVSATLKTTIFANVH